MGIWLTNMLCNNSFRLVVLRQTLGTLVFFFFLFPPFPSLLFFSSLSFTFFSFFPSRETKGAKRNKDCETGWSVLFEFISSVAVADDFGRTGRMMWLIVLLVVKFSVLCRVQTHADQFLTLTFFSAMTFFLTFFSQPDLLPLFLHLSTLFFNSLYSLAFIPIIFLNLLLWSVIIS